MNSLLQLKEYFSKEGILINFCGAFNHSIIEEIGNATRKYLEGEQLEKGVITDVFAVYIEQTQNINNYLKRRNLTQGADSVAIIMISNRDDLYIISSGNSILKEDVPALTEYLEHLNSLDKAGLRKLYKEQMRKPVPEGAYGAGLGLIDMSRRAYLKLEYQFEHQNDTHDFFNLKVTVKGA
ncbi:MAG: SiaB family protein kinase [Candidatus Cloacimonetes bacterium]|jgi:hypothetical protein|nr:SiaB family protein kinase [Candidatus Cloacimonadota bacterium]